MAVRHKKKCPYKYFLYFLSSLLAHKVDRNRSELLTRTALGEILAKSNCN